MQELSVDEVISKTAKNLHNHAQRMRVKAWRMIQGNNYAEAQLLLAAANTCDRALAPMVLRGESVWKRR